MGSTHALARNLPALGDSRSRLATSAALAEFPAIFVAHDFTRRKILEKQVPSLRDLVATDEGYEKYLEERVASGKRRDGSPALRQALRTQVAQAVAEGARLEPAQEWVDLSQFKSSFAGDRFDCGAVFDDFFALRRGTRLPGSHGRPGPRSRSG